jgi:hypothetical protein
VHNKKSANSYSNQQNFSYTGAEQSFTIPGGVNSILIKKSGVLKVIMIRLALMEED